MKHISNVIDINAIGSAPTPKPETYAYKEQTANVVNSLFSKLKSICSAWKQAWPTEDDENRAKRTWCDAFKHVNIHRIEQIRFGLKRCALEGTPFIPHVGDFIKWCTPSPEDLGIPSAYDAFNEAVKNCYFAETNPVWSHDAVYYAKCQIPTEHLTKLPKEKAFQLFSYHYEIACRKILHGEQLPKKPEPKGLTHEPQQNPEVAKSALAEMRAKLGMK